MPDRKTYPLYTVFENLLANGTAEFANRPAIWHVPDPLHLYQFSAIESNINEVMRRTSNAVHTITFSELNAMANRMAIILSKQIRQHIRLSSNAPVNGVGMYESAKPVQSSFIVALFMPPSIDRIIAQLACMKLHLPYLPLDRQLSIGRILQIIELVTPVMVIVARDYHTRMFHNPSNLSNVGACRRIQREAISAGKLENLKVAFQTIFTVVWETLVDQTSKEFACMNGAAKSMELEQNTCTGFGIPRSVCLFPDAENPVVIVLFTSGSSTAGHKVVRLRQSQLYNRLQWQWTTGVEWTSEKEWISRESPHNLERDEISLASTACLFVDAFTEMFSALFAGIPIVVPGGSVCASEACVSDVRILAKLVEVFGITRITTVPVQLGIWINQVRLISSTERAREFRSLRTVVVSGDILLPQLAQEFFQIFANQPIRLLNFYGTTELAGDVAAAVFHQEHEVCEATRYVDTKDQGESLLDGAPFVAVGKPIWNTTIYIVRRTAQADRVSGQRHDSGSLVMVVPDNVDPVSIKNLSILGTANGDQIDWEAEGYGVCEKGCVGEIAVTGLAAYDNASKLFDLKKLKENASPEDKCAVLTRDNSNNTPCINFPGDLGFVCPKDGLLYVCGRSDELVKINAVGFLAGDVDRLIDRIKQTCAQNPQQMSTLELKLSRIQQTVTIPNRHPINKNKQLVCFYTTSEQTTASQPLASFGITQPITEILDSDRRRTELDSNETGMDCSGPSPTELAAIIANYLPVYIKPIFIHIDRIPVMPTSGKIDKQGLRVFYEKSVMNATKPKRLQTSVHSWSAERPAINGGCSHRSISPSLLHHDDVFCTERLEQARMVLANVLGLDYLGTTREKSRPRDDEDFYILGGNSLSAVLALESLRQLGFKIHLETFYHTGNIGQILQSLRTHIENNLDGIVNVDHGATSDRGCMPLGKTQNNLTNTIISQHDENMLVTEWEDDENGQLAQNMYSFNDIVELLADTFDRNDQVTHTFQLSQSDLKIAASIYLDVSRHGQGIVLTASIGNEVSDKSDIQSARTRNQLVGSLISLPMESIPELPVNHNLHILQKYFEFCSALHSLDVNPKRTLTVIMVGIRPPVMDDSQPESQSVRAKWKRLSLEILAKLETELLRLAQERNYTHVETLNTSEATMELCLELGYTILKTTRMKQFLDVEHIVSDSTYHHHCCYHMIKVLHT